MKKLFLVIIAILFLGTVSFGEEEKKDIKVGLISALSGKIAPYGMTTMNGMKLAIEQANEAGGIDGRQIKLSIQDNKGNSDETLTIANKLINVDKVVAILGPVISTNSLALAPIAQEEKVPMLTATGTNIDITKAGEYVARTCFVDPFQGEAIANFAVDDLKAKTAIIMTDLSSDYSLGLSKAFEKTFEAAGQKVINQIAYDVNNDVDFSSHLIKIKSKNPDVVFVPGYSEVAGIVKQARDLGIESVFLGGDGWDTQDILDNGGKALNGSFITTHFSKDDQSDVVQNFLKDYRERFSQEPSVLSVLGYDAGLVFVEALKNVEEINRESIKDAINATQDLQGVTGVITLDENRNPIKPAHILEAKDGKYVYKTSIMPKEKEEKDEKIESEVMKENEDQAKQENRNEEGSSKTMSIVITFIIIFIVVIFLFRKKK